MTVKPGMLVSLCRPELQKQDAFHFREAGKKNDSEFRTANCGDVALVLARDLSYVEWALYTILIDGVKASFAECYLEPLGQNVK